MRRLTAFVQWQIENCPLDPSHLSSLQGSWLPANMDRKGCLLFCGGGVGVGVGGARGGLTEPTVLPPTPTPRLKQKAFYLSLLPGSLLKGSVYVCKFAREGSENICKTVQCLERNSSNKRCIILNALNFDSGNSCTRVSISRQRRYHMTAHVKAPWSPLVDSHPLSHSPPRGLLALPLPPGELA